MRGPRLAVTGSKGLLGTYFRRLTGPEGCVALTSDVTDLDEVRAGIQTLRPDVLLNFAGVVPLRKVDSDPQRARAVNVGGARNLAEACQEFGVRLLHLSSSHVYGSGSYARAEDQVLNPEGEYGEQKLAAEAMISGLLDPQKIVFARVFSVASAQLESSFLTPAVLKRISKGEEPIDVSASPIVRDFVHPREVARLLNILVASDVSGAINISVGRSAQLGSYVEWLRGIDKHDLETPEVSILPRISPTRDHPTDSRSLFSDTRKLEALLQQCDMDLNRVAEPDLQLLKQLKREANWTRLLN